MGKKYTYICETCGHQQQMLIGIGRHYPSLSQRVKEMALAGHWGKDYQVLIDQPSTVIDATRQLYTCEQGHLLNSLSKDVYRSRMQEEGLTYAFYFSASHYEKIYTYPHLCPLCAYPMKRISIMPETIHCPICHQDMKLQDISFWD